MYSFTWLDTLIYEWKRFRRMKFFEWNFKILITTFICTISPKWRNEEMANNNIILCCYILYARSWNSAYPVKDSSEVHSLTREESQLRGSKPNFRSKKSYFYWTTSKVKSHWIKLMNIKHLVLLFKWVEEL